MPNEFSLIQQYFAKPFARQVAGDGRVSLGIGDDCALLNLKRGFQLAVSVDTLVSGVHFPSSAPAEKIAQRALRVNLSDLAAMGAEPLGFTLSLTLPDKNPQWLESFAKGLFECAQAFDIPLVGGDTTRGPLTINIQVMGQVPTGNALTRSQAQVGDDIYVSGSLGEAAAALSFLESKQINEQQQFLHKRYYFPEPELKLGMQLRSLASSAIDISDGLVADLGHICENSHVAAEIHWQKIPLSNTLKTTGNETYWQCWALTGGDDYRLCFTAPKDCAAELKNLSVHHIGSIVAQTDSNKPVTVFDNGEPLFLAETGYQHF
ncbi:MAG: thiamine-phosphate kinase [Cellvibrionaceae bacterium]